MNIFGIGLPEMAVIAAIGLLVFGPKRLPELGKTLGKTLKGFQSASSQFEQEFRKAVDTVSNDTMSTAVLSADSVAPAGSQVSPAGPDLVAGATPTPVAGSPEPGAPEPRALDTVMAEPQALTAMAAPTPLVASSEPPVV